MSKTTNRIFQKSKIFIFIIAIAIILCISIEGYSNEKKHKGLNILFILTDNQPPSTIGCYGNKEIKTPNINKLAKKGIKFTNAFACNGMSSPTRCSIMTGLMPSQHGVHTQLSDQLQKTWPKNWCAINEFRTLPQTLSDANYNTALIGKFHMGIPFVPQLKFKYWVTFNLGHTWSWYGNLIIDNGKEYIHEGDISDFWTNKAVDYIKNYDDEKPFFLYLAYDGPYGLPPSISGPAKNRFASLYEGKDLKSSPRLPANRMLIDYVMQGPEHYASGFSLWIKTLLFTLNDTTSMNNYASQITLIDDGIGKVLKTLKEKGLDSNTLIIFSSDQGIAYGQKGFWGQTEDSIPSNLYDTPIRIPLIFSHAGKIKKNQTSDIVVGTVDLFPTILDYLEMQNITIKNCAGKSFANLLKNQTINWENITYIEQEQTRAARTDKWKYIKRFPSIIKSKKPVDKQFLKMISTYPKEDQIKIEMLMSDPPIGEELYDMINDPLEQNNLAFSKQHAKIKKQLAQKLDSYFNKYSESTYNLWKGGTVKSNSNVAYIWKKQWGQKWHPITPVVKHPFDNQ